MPIIKGVKMACEPCIRGHRSTKCNHASERMMVPVRKPGRPLSACPHPREQTCGCGGITAAIPRKQACGCGTSQGTSQTSQLSIETTMNMDSGSQEVTSPTRSSYKVQRNGRPSSSRKQSFDPANFERMDMNSVRVHSFMPANSQVRASAASSDSRKPWVGSTYDETENKLPSALPTHGNGRPRSSGSNSLSDMSSFGPVNGAITPQEFGGQPQNSFVESNGVSLTADGISPFYGTAPTSHLIIEAEVKTQLSPCCQNRNSYNGENSTHISEAPPIGSTYHSGIPAQNMVKNEPMMTPQMATQMLSHPMEFTQGYTHYAVQPTVFTYPATYGSFQNPLQPQIWYQSHMTNGNGMPQPLPQTMIGQFASQPGPVSSEGMDTIHNCDCGPGCECIGCAAHPYNVQTLNNVRSVTKFMNMARQNDPFNENHILPREVATAHPNHQSLSDGQNGLNGEMGHNGQNGQNGHARQNSDLTSSPTAQTPSSTTSQNAEEQILPESDFLFVNYPDSFPGNPLQGDGCEGSQYGCPCGDDCACIGCSIHNNTHDPLV